MARVTFIAEIGNNHNGDIERAKRLILESKKIGCHIAKFQLRDMHTLYRGDEDNVEDLGVEYTKDLLFKYELSFEEQKELSEFCSLHEIEYMCTPWDVGSVNKLEELGVMRYKIASADFDNIELIEVLINTRKPLIFSTGMSTNSEIVKRVQYLDQKNVDYTILHCNSTYPAPFEDIELNYIKTLKSLTKNVGYSGHERGIGVSLAAIALGACVIERHITEDKSLEGPDHQASLLASEFGQLIEMSNEVVPSLGEYNIIDRKVSQGAMLNREILGKSLISKFDLNPGHVLTAGDVTIKSPGQGLPPSKINHLIGMKVQKKIKSNEFLFYDHFKIPVEVNYSQLNNINWGVPVRPHDVIKMHTKFDCPVYEFHISYKDLERKIPDENWTILKNKRLILHAPELFSDSRLLDLCDTDNIQIHLDNLNSVCDYARELRKKIETTQDIKIVTNIGGFSTHNFRDEKEKEFLYNLIENNLKHINEEGCQITIQNMAPFPWHFGGQRYQNIFAYPDEIIDFCIQTGRKITLDTSHLSMHCAYRGEDFIGSVKKLIPYTEHWHIGDALGVNGEGITMGEGDIDFNTLMPLILKKQTMIVETWQGHKENGSGFVRDLNYLGEIMMGASK